MKRSSALLVLTLHLQRLPVVHVSSQLEIEQILRAAKVIAVVGCSDDPTRPSHRVARYLQEAGYKIVPVNPNHEELLGETCYPSVDSIPDEVEIDIVDIFRHPSHTADVVRDVVKRMEQLDQRPVVWTQIGVSSAEARRLADEAGLRYITNRCAMVERERLEQ